MKVIALGHRSRVGKDTAAKMLISMLRISGKYKCVQKRAFATKLKEATHSAFSQYGLQPGEFYEQPENEHLRKVKLPGIDKDPVDLWIGMGQKMREMYPAVWLDAVLMPKDCDIIVVSDLRFLNEADAVKASGGLTVKIENPKVTEWRASDCELKDYQFDETIINDGNLNDLYTKVEAFAKKHQLLGGVTA